METTFIYSLSDPDTGEIRYIGKSNDVSRRAKEHLKFVKTRKGYWVRSLLQQGKTPLVEVLDTVPIDEWQFWEQFWVQFFAGYGCNLVNGDRGGLGTGRTSEELKKKISNKLKGRVNPSMWQRVAAYDTGGRFVFEAASMKDASEFAGVTGSNIASSILKNNLCGGYQWAYIDKNTKIGDVAMRIAGHAKKPNAMTRHEVRAKVSAANIGKTVSKEAREKMRYAKLGKPPSNKGVPCTDMQRLKNREASTVSKPVYGVRFDGFVVSEWSSIKHCSEETGVARATIAKHIAGKRKRATQQIWFGG